ncbi:peptide deformylase, mitochondrial-like [Chironomus tepperi]|uniref:peptide deformylase, mitochondrial-like n=1 Tax=Chironomus tepperi TaxID=113505 RepID=UPI00391F5A18
MNLGKLLINSLKSHQSSHRHASFLKSIKSFVKVDKYVPPYVHLIQVGDPILRTVSDPVPEDLITSKEITFLLNRLEQVRQNYGLVGIAAPQIGINLRIILACFDKDNMKAFKPEIQKSKEMSLMPLTVFINPDIKVLDHRKVIFEESCGSVTGYAADVPRPYSIEVTSFNEKGVKQTGQFSGWNARIIQHENDHLNGILFTDLMDRKTLRCTNWEAVNRKAGKIEIPFYPKKIWD